MRIDGGYLKPRSSAGNCSWRLFPSSNKRLSLASLEDPSRFFSFRRNSESCARPIVKIPSKIALCNPDGKMEPTPSVMVWCTAKPDKGKKKKTCHQWAWFFLFLKRVVKKEEKKSSQSCKNEWTLKCFSFHWSKGPNTTANMPNMKKGDSCSSYQNLQWLGQDQV